MTRSELRGHIFMMLFRVEFHEGEDISKQSEVYVEDIENINAKDESYIKSKCENIIMKLPEIDETINTHAEKWKTSRMSKVDLTIIRLAVYEMKYDDDIPVSVAINEAVNLAKKYGTDESPSFVNGVLARINE